MIEENELPSTAAKPEDDEVKKTSLLRTLMSLALFIAVYYMLFKSWLAVVSLVSMIVIHESGHFLAMKFFGYKSVNMTFIPFIGAYVSGQAIHLSRKNKIIVLLAGPLPGILIGCVLFYIYMLSHDYAFYQFASPFLLLNMFNLLPVFPLDGGQVLQALFFKGSRMFQLVFMALSVIVLVFLFFKFDYAWLLLVAAAVVLFRIGKMMFISKVRKKLDEDGIDYACSYNDLTDEEYWQIRNVLISNSKTLSRKYDVAVQAEDEQEIIKYIESVLVPAYEDDLTLGNKLFFILLWILAYAVPLLLWANYKGMP